MTALVSRKQALVGLAGAAGAVIAAGAGGYELVEHDVLPGKHYLEQLTGACSVAVPPQHFGPLGMLVSGRFYSHARHREVGYAIGYPHVYLPNRPPPLVICLHGHGGSHRSFDVQRLAALLLGGVPAVRAAFVAVDGGDGYWNRHPGDDPMSMVIDELIPRCRLLGLGRGQKRIGLYGYSMGGYGALLLAEKRPDLVGAVAVISPALWLSYQEAHAADPTAYASKQAFEANDILRHRGRLRGIPIRLATGFDDPFYSDVQVVASKLPAGTVSVFSKGCHTGGFPAAQVAPSLAFLGRYLGRG